MSGQQIRVFGFIPALVKLSSTATSASSLGPCYFSPSSLSAGHAPHLLTKIKVEEHSDILSIVPDNSYKGLHIIDDSQVLSKYLATCFSSLTSFQFIKDAKKA